MRSLRLPVSEHTLRPWRIHELTPDFKVEDVWALPTPGGPHDFPQLVQLLISQDPTSHSPIAVRALFAMRTLLGKILRLDERDTGVGRRVSSLRDRLPEDLADAATGPTPEALPFNPLFMLQDEWAGEAANRTMHGVLHLGWVRDEAGGYRGQMAVLVKPNGLFGEAYMAAIKPFRYLIVYPLIIRGLERRWRHKRLVDRAGTMPA